MKILFAVLLVLILAGCEVQKPSSISTQQDRENIAIKAQQDAQKATAEMTIKQQEAFRILQLDVAKRCTDKGNIPIFVNGNVDCKVMPK